MRYIRVRWIHELADEPVQLFSELDEDGFELRKVEQYANGHRDVASRVGGTGSTLLGEEPVPSLDAINAQSEFVGEEITANDFERVWNEAWKWFDDH